jgi:hypothetical protein
MLVVFLQFGKRINCRFMKKYQSLLAFLFVFIGLLFLAVPFFLLNQTNTHLILGWGFIVSGFVMYCVFFRNS